MTKKNPTKIDNSDLWLKLGQHDELLKQILDQTQKTNGRVTLLEKMVGALQEWKKKADTIADYLKDHPTKAKEGGWTTREKQLIAFITALLAILATLVKTGKI